MNVAVIEGRSLSAYGEYREKHAFECREQKGRRELPLPLRLAFPTPTLPSLCPGSVSCAGESCLYFQHQAVAMGLLKHGSPPMKNGFFQPHNLGARAPLTLRTDRECLIICLNV